MALFTRKTAVVAATSIVAMAIPVLCRRRHALSPLLLATRSLAASASGGRRLPPMKPPDLDAEQQVLYDEIANTRIKILSKNALFDADGSGSIDATELREALIAAGQEMVASDPAQLEALMAKYDSDNSASIDEEEFINMIADCSTLRQGAMAADDTTAYVAAGGGDTQAA